MKGSSETEHGMQLGSLQAPAQQGIPGTASRDCRCQQLPGSIQVSPCSSALQSSASLALPKRFMALRRASTSCCTEALCLSSCTISYK